MHVDSFGSHFWMFLVSGTKRWHIYPPTMRPYLYEDRAAQIFEVDSFDLDIAKYPLAKRTLVYEAELKPGELLFVPSGSPHQVFLLPLLSL